MATQIAPETVTADADHSCAMPSPRAVLSCSAASDPDTIAFMQEHKLDLGQVLMAMFEQSDSCVKVISTEGELLYMNPGGRDRMEIPDEMHLAGQRWSSLWPIEQQPAIEEAVAMARNGQTAHLEAFCPTARGTPKWWQVAVSPIQDVNGKTIMLLSSSRDITARRSRTQQLETVMHEMRHRLRNAYTISASIATGAAREAPEHRAFAVELAERLRLLADVQVSLIDAGDKAATMRALVEQVVTGYGRLPAELTLGDMPDTTLGESSVRTLTLVLGELANNSLKHGAFAHGGHVTIRGETDPKGVALFWDETRNVDGKTDADAEPVAPVRKTTGSGSGQGLMQRMTALQGGSFDTDLTDVGFHARVVVNGR